MPTPSVPVGPLYSQFLNELQWALGRRLRGSCGAGPCGPARRRGRPRLGGAAAGPVSVPGSDLGPQGVAVLKRSGARPWFTLGPERVEGAHALLMDHDKVGHGAGVHLQARGRRRIGVVVPENPAWRSSPSPGSTAYAGP